MCWGPSDVEPGQSLVVCDSSHTHVGSPIYTRPCFHACVFCFHQEGQPAPWNTFVEKMAVGMGQMETKVFPVDFPGDFEVSFAYCLPRFERFLHMGRDQSGLVFFNLRSVLFVFLYFLRSLKK